MDNSNNVWKQFEGILPSQKRYSCLIISVDVPNNQSVVEKRSGDRTVAIGTTVTAGNRAWVVDGVITGGASDLPFSEIVE